MATKITFTDYFETELANIKKDPNKDVPQQYTEMMLVPLIGNYDDINDYINIQKALTRLMELNNEHIEQCTKLTWEQS